MRTPLTAIRGLAETLELTELPAPERVRGLARMQSEGVRLNREWHALDEIIGSALARVSGVLAGHTVRTQLPADLPLVELDAIAFERVLVNVLDNAAKYTPLGSTVTIRARTSGNTMKIVVEDNGPGLLDTERIFDCFTRGVKESSITGVGFGLALCRTIIEAHGGTIQAERCLPQGTRFEIALPLGFPPDIEHDDHEISP